MTETDTQYKWLPVTAADEWWLLPVEEVRMEAFKRPYSVSHMFNTKDDDELPISVIYLEDDRHSHTWMPLCGKDGDQIITRRVRVEQEKQATPPKPARTVPADLNAANFPAWAHWARNGSWRKGEKQPFAVCSNGIWTTSVGFRSWHDLQNGNWQLGDTDGNWYDVPQIGGGE